MAEILTFSLGFAFGWWVKRRFFVPAFADSDMARLSNEWSAHLTRHAELQKPSLVWTAPEMKVCATPDPMTAS